MSTIRAYEYGNYKDKTVYLDSAKIEIAHLRLDIQRHIEPVYADYDNMIEVGGHLIPTPTIHATDLKEVGREIKGTLDIPVGKKILSMEFVAGEIDADNNRGVLITHVLFTTIKVIKNIPP